MEKKNFFSILGGVIGAGAVAWLAWKTKKNYDELTKQEKQELNNLAEAGVDLDKAEELKTSSDEVTGGCAKQPTTFITSLFRNAFYCDQKGTVISEMVNAEEAVKGNFASSIHFFQRKRNEIYLSQEFRKHQNSEFLEIAIPFPDFYNNKSLRGKFGFGDCTACCRKLEEDIRVDIFNSRIPKGNFRVIALAKVEINDPLADDDEDEVKGVIRWVEVPLKITTLYDPDNEGRRGVSNMFRSFKVQEAEEAKEKRDQNANKLTAFDKDEFYEWLTETFGEEAEPECLDIVPFVKITYPIKDLHSQFGITLDTGLKILDTLSKFSVGAEGGSSENTVEYKYFLFHADNSEGAVDWNWIYDTYEVEGKPRLWSFMLDDYED